VDSIPNPYSNSLAFISAPLVVLFICSSRRCNEGDSGHCAAVRGFSLMTAERGGGRCPPSPRLLKKASSIRLLLKGHKAKAEGESNLLLRCSPFFRLDSSSAYFHKAYNYLGTSPSSENEWGLCRLLSSALCCFWEEGSLINICSSVSETDRCVWAQKTTFPQVHLTNVLL